MTRNETFWPDKHSFAVKNPIHAFMFYYRAQQEANPTQKHLLFKQRWIESWKMQQIKSDSSSVFYAAAPSSSAHRVLLLLLLLPLTSSFQHVACSALTFDWVTCLALRCACRAWNIKAVNSRRCHILCFIQYLRRHFIVDSLNTCDGESCAISMSALQLPPNNLFSSRWEGEKKDETYGGYKRTLQKVCILLRMLVLFHF